MISIALAYDFEELSSKLIEEGLKLATLAKARVFLVHIAAPDPHLLAYQMRRSKVERERKAELRAEKRILDRIAHRFIDQGIETEVILEQGPAVEGLIKTVKKIKADYLLIGHHREKAIFRKVLDSSARRLLELSPIPVICVALKD